MDSLILFCFIPSDLLNLHTFKCLYESGDFSIFHMEHVFCNSKQTEKIYRLLELYFIVYIVVTLMSYTELFRNNIEFFGLYDF